MSKEDVPVNVKFQIQLQEPTENVLYALAPKGAAIDAWSTGNAFVKEIASNGVYVLYAKNASGQETSKEVELVTVDQKPPKIQSIELVNNDWCRETSITVSATDATELQYHFWQDGGADSGWINTSEYTITKNGVWRVSAKDAAGNETTQEIQVKNIDNEPPLILSAEVSDLGSCQTNLLQGIESVGESIFSVSENAIENDVKTLEKEITDLERKLEEKRKELEGRK